jgi:hypothetical protein
MMKKLFWKFSPSAFRFLKWHMTEHHVDMQTYLALFCNLSAKMVEHGHVHSVKRRINNTNRRDEKAIAKQIMTKVILIFNS